MNIFYIPSWYPSEKHFISGSFFKDQALFIGKILKGSLIINLWGDQSTKINLEKPFEVLPNLAAHLASSPSQRKIDRRVWEFRTPALEWSPRFLSANINRLIRASEKNFLLASKKFNKITLIHAQVCFPAGYIAMKLSAKYKIPYIITEHMGPFPIVPFNKKNLLPLVKEPLKKAALVLSVSPSLKKELEKYNIKSQVVPNMVDEKSFHIGSVGNRPFTFLSLGDICPEKGFEDLLKAFPEVKKLNQNVRLRIGGEGSHKGKYQKLAERLKISDKVQWLGRLSRAQVKKEMANCHSVVLASHHESFGLVLVEALSSGKPVISTYSGGPESIVNKTNGLLVEIGKPKQLAETMLKMISQYKSYEPNAIRKQTLKKFGSRVVAKEIIDIYDKVLKKYVRNYRYSKI